MRRPVIGPVRNSDRGRPDGEIIFAEPGYGVEVKQGYGYAGWPGPVYHCRADDRSVEIELAVPRGAGGVVRLHMIDPDGFGGGRRQEVFVAGESIGVVSDFGRGRWLEHRVGAGQTAGGKVPIRIANARPASNAVVSIIEWVEPPEAR